MFLSNLITTWHGNNIHKHIAIWFVPYTILEPVKVALSQRLTADKKNRLEEGKLATYYQMANGLLETNATDGLVTERGSSITEFKKPIRISAE